MCCFNTITFADTVHDYLQSLFACLEKQYEYTVLSYHDCEVVSKSLWIHLNLVEKSVLFPISESFDLSDLEKLLSALFCLPGSRIHFFVNVHPRWQLHSMIFYDTLRHPLNQ